MQQLARALPLALSTVVAIACAPGNTAQQVIKSPEYQPGDQTKCHAVASTAEPLVVEWPSAARGQLEDIVENRKAVAVVRYEGCQMKVLAGCTAPGKLAYAPFRNSKQDQVRITNADDLYASLPVGAASLEAKLQRAGELDVEMTLVGRYETDATAVTASQLQGDCEGATHIVKAVTVGAFDFHTGASANVAGGAKVLGAGVGGASSAAQENLARDGKVESCAAAKVDDVDPPANCGALVRLEVVPLGASPRAITNVDCPPGAKWDGAKCAANVDTSCAGGMHFQPGTGCVADSPRPQPPPAGASAGGTGTASVTGSVGGHSVELRSGCAIENPSASDSAPRYSVFLSNQPDECARLVSGRYHAPIATLSFDTSARGGDYDPKGGVAWVIQSQSQCNGGSAPEVATGGQVGGVAGSSKWLKGSFEVTFPDGSVQGSFDIPVLPHATGQTGPLAGSAPWVCLP